MKRGGNIARYTRLDPGTKGLARTGGPTRTKRIAKVGRRAKRDAPSLTLFRETIYERCGCDSRRVGSCESCGVLARIEANHIVGRGRAPGWIQLHNPDLNGLGCCRRCHARFTDYPELAGPPFERAMEAWRAERTNG